MSHITIAASAEVFKNIFNTVRDNFTFSTSDSKNFGPYSASYSVNLHLSDGTVNLNDNNTIEIKNVDIIFDTLTTEICFDLPGFCVGGWCIIPDPWNGCLVGIPEICIGGPICAPLDLSGLTSEISDLKASLVPKYYVDPARTPNESDYDAEVSGHPNKWQIFIDPVWVNVNPIDIPSTIGNFLEQAVKNAIYNWLPSWFPDWAKDLIWGAIGPIISGVKAILGIVGEITDWISDLLFNLFGLIGLIETAIADYFANKYPIYWFEDPYPILPSSATLIPVKIPIRDLTAKVNSKEMVVTANVGV